ncbi:MAG: DUF4325 domain-containing protein [Desulfotignum sp.]|jgi:anti-sigma regulatory factor (Ser/Thr protein kinase)|nr:DUF4325 domain-containing protein [Desulfotignum sp.]
MKFTEEVINTIKKYIVSNVSKNPNLITSQTCEYFEISRPTVLKYIRELIDSGILEKKGSNRYPNYQLVKTKYSWDYDNQDLEEDILWTRDISPKLTDLPGNVKTICQYGFTEMVNNVVDHSGADKLFIRLTIDYLNVLISVMDNGIGIFKKIKEDLGLDHSRQSILELAKGKFTSDPENHSGEGIFFTSRVFDIFAIHSHELHYYGFGNTEGIMLEDKNDTPGTLVHMQIKKESSTQLGDIFMQFSDPDKDPSFHKTIIPVKLMEHEGESLISRSQAKRLISRFDRFTEVVLDFQGVTQIGQAFADQIFRVFQKRHPQVRLTVFNAIENVENMIKRAQSIPSAF